MRRAGYLLALLVVAGCILWAQEVPNERAPRFEPAQVLATTTVPYPINSVTWGTVILSVSVGPSGEVESVRVVKSVPSLTDAAIKAVKNWKFKPATFGGKPVTTSVIATFSFSPPMVAPRT